jgi:hypothetical protein
MQTGIPATEGGYAPPRPNSLSHHWLPRGGLAPNTRYWVSFIWSAWPYWGVGLCGSFERVFAALFDELTAAAEVSEEHQVLVP